MKMENLYNIIDKQFDIIIFHDEVGGKRFNNIVAEKNGKFVLD